MKLHKVELTEQLNELPDVDALSVAASRELPAFDLGVFVLGFEERCVGIANLLSQADVTCRRVRYLTYATNLDDNRANERPLTDSLKGMSEDVEDMLGDAPDFSARLAETLEAVCAESDHARPKVLFDMSVASERLIMRCMKAFMDADIELTVLYAEAAEYHPTIEEWRKDRERWIDDDDSLGLEQGIGELDYSVEYPGTSLEPLPEFLVIFASFSHERAQAIVNAVDPTLGTAEGRERLVWFVGEPHLAEDSWRAEAAREINRLGEKDRQIAASTFQYKEVLRELDAVHRGARAHHRVTISPMGSKLQTLGASLFCHMHDDVRVVLARPREYSASNYSHGCKAMWLLRFGQTERVRHALRRVGSLVVDTDDRGSGK